MTVPHDDLDPARGVLWTFAAVVMLYALAANSCYGQTRTERFQWGAETWLSGQRDLSVWISEPAPVYLVAVEGALTAAPVSSFVVADNVSRQVLITLVNGGAVDPGNVYVLTRPPGANHGVSRHIFSVNAKVTGSAAVVVPINYRFEPPIRLPMNQLTLHFDASSWRSSPDGNGYRDNTYPVGINAETQLTVTYRTGP